MEDSKDFLKIWDSLPKDIQETLKRVVEESSSTSEEQFIAEIMIGECAKCGSNQTKDCEKVEGIEDFSVGLCINCGYLWCSECGRSLVQDIKCKHWVICDTCEKADELGYCDIDALDCEKLNKDLG
jgi:hypothetical protein